MQKLYIILAFSLYTTSILLFGDLSSLCQIVSFPLSIILLYLNTYRETKYSSLIDGIILGIFSGVFRLSPFSAHINKTIIEISFSWSNILGYWISLVGYLTFILLYRKAKKLKLYEDFNYDNKKILRNERIDRILSKF